MKKIFLIIIIPFLLVVQDMEAAKNKYGFGGNIEKSIAVVPLTEVSNFTEELVTGTIGIFANGTFKISRNSYFNFNVGYTSYSMNESQAPNVSASSTDLRGLWINYFDKPNDFTPYLGGGFGINLVTVDSPEGQSEFLTYLEEFSFSLIGKFGFNIPLNDNLVLDPAIQLDYNSDPEIGIVPKINVGILYWVN